MRVSRTVKKVVMDCLISVLTRGAGGGVNLADPMQESIEGDVTHVELHKNTCFCSGQVICSCQEGMQRELSVDLIHVPPLGGLCPKGLPSLLQVCLEAATKCSETVWQWSIL